MNVKMPILLQVLLLLLKRAGGIILNFFKVVFTIIEFHCRFLGKI